MDEVCPICKGKESIRRDEGTYEACVCLKRKYLSRHLGPEIADASNILNSTLYVVQDRKCVSDLTLRNVFITSSWNGLLPHLKWALANKGTDFRYKVITDEDIKTVFVGAMTQKAQAASGVDGPVFNSLKDLVGDGIALIILKFGYLGHPNRAAAGAVLEALYIREALRLPTWLVSTPDRPFAGGHSYSGALDLYIDRKYKKVDIDSESLPDEPQEDKYAPTAGMAIEADEPPDEENAVISERTPVPVIAPSQIDDAMFGSGDRWKKKSGSSYKKKRRPGDPDDGLPEV